MSIYEDKPAIIHLHGDIFGVGMNDFVFTVEDYLKIKRAHTGFTMALQALFLRYSVLFVGYGGNDPHIEEFMENIRYSFGWSSYPEFPTRYFTAIAQNEIDKVQEAYREMLGTDIILLEDAPAITTFLSGLQKLAPRQ